MISRRFFTLVSALAAAAIFAGTALAQDKPKAAATPTPSKPVAPAKGEEDTKVIVENDKVRVTETRYKPGASSAMRERGVRVTRALSDGTMERTRPDGKKETIHWKAGEVKYSPKDTFANKNVGKTEMVLYTVTLK